MDHDTSTPSPEPAASPPPPPLPAPSEEFPDREITLMDRVWAGVGLTAALFLAYVFADVLLNRALTGRVTRGTEA